MKHYGYIGVILVLLWARRADGSGLKIYPSQKPYEKGCQVIQDTDVAKPTGIRFDQAEEGKFYTLILNDPDAPSGGYLHWVLENIKASDLKSSRGTTQGDQALAYKGPAPPKAQHRYFFLLYEQTNGEITNVQTISSRVSMTKAKLENDLKLKEAASFQFSAYSTDQPLCAKEDCEKCRKS